MYSDYPLSSINLPSELSVVKTKSQKVQIAMIPESADAQGVVWSCDNGQILSVDEDGVIKGLKVGTANVIAKVKYDTNISSSCKVNVSSLLVSSLELLTPSVVKTIPTQLNAKVIPAEADNPKLKWTLLTPEVATLSETGVLTGLKMGTAKVKIESTDGSMVSQVFDVSITGLPVSSISLPNAVSIVKTKQQKLDYGVYPAASDNQSLKWSSSNTDVVSVDESSGIITAHKVGRAIITATAEDGSNTTASTVVDVEPLKVESIKLIEKVSIVKTNMLKLEPSVLPELADDKTLIWSSDNKSIATVDEQGVVKGVNVGTVHISARAQDGSGVLQIV